MNASGAGKKTVRLSQETLEKAKTSCFEIRAKQVSFVAKKVIVKPKVELSNEACDHTPWQQDKLCSRDQTGSIVHSTSPFGKTDTCCVQEDIECTKQVPCAFNPSSTYSQSPPADRWDVSLLLKICAPPSLR